MNKLRFCGTSGWKNLVGEIYYEANFYITSCGEGARFMLIKVFRTQKQAEEYGKRVVDRFNRIYK